MVLPFIIVLIAFLYRSKLTHSAAGPHIEKKFACLIQILPQTLQPLLCSIKHIIILTNRKSQIVFRQMSIFLGIKLRWRNSRNAQLHNQEPG